MLRLGYRYLLFFLLMEEIFAIPRLFGYAMTILIVQAIQWRFVYDNDLLV